MAKDVPQMIRGLSMGSRFLGGLIDEIRAKGGREEMLYFLASDRAGESLAKVAEFIVSLPWRVPLSLVMELAWEYGKGQDYGEQEEDYNCFYWAPVMHDLRIPEIRVGGDEARNSGFSVQRPLPVDLLNQLCNRTAEPGMLVNLEGEEYVVTLLYAGRNSVPKRGMQIDREEVVLVHLAPSFFFDLNS